jgi:ribosomal protein L11 methylase PrmA
MSSFNKEKEWLKLLTPAIGRKKTIKDSGTGSTTLSMERQSLGAAKAMLLDPIANTRSI